MGRSCKNCGVSIEHKKSNAVYCSDKCKSEYWLYGEDSKKVKSAKKGSIKKRDFLKTVKIDVKSMKSARDIPLRGVIEDKTNDLPEIPKTIKNPVKEKLKSKLQKLKEELFAKKVRLQELITSKNQMENSLPIFWSATTGAVIGAYWKNSAKEEDNAWSTILKTCIGGFTGGGLGWLIKKQLDKEIAEISKKLIPSIKARIDNLQVNLTLTGIDFEKLPELIPNPEYNENNGMSNSEESPVHDKVQTRISSSKIICSEDLKKMNFRSLNFKNTWLNLLGQPAVNFRMAVFGKPGQGKSTFCLQLAHYLADNFGRVLYVSGEEGFSKTLKDKFQNNRAYNKNLHIANIHSGDELMDEVPQNTYHFIFIDSLNNMGIDENDLLRIEEFYSNTAIITISQSTKNGNFRGSQEILHNADITLKVENGFAECMKNRFNSIGFEYAVFQ